MTSDYSSESIRELYERNFDTLYRVCYMYMKNIQDTEDAVHNAFLKAIETRKQFESENHEKAWLMICTPKVRHIWRCIFLWAKQEEKTKRTRQN